MGNTVKTALGAAAVLASMSLYANNDPHVAKMREQASGISERFTASLGPAEREEIRKSISNAMSSGAMTISGKRFVVAVNRNPAGQTGSVLLVDEKGGVEEIFSSKISSGTKGRKGYFLTPTGVFLNSAENGNYRAVGTKNSNGVRGLGVKGSRVYDFGWVESVAGWNPGIQGKIRMQMHSTDPDTLESKLGTPASKGCIRVQGKINEIIDQFGVLDQDYEENRATHWIFSKNKNKTPYSGKFVIVYDAPK